MAHIQVEEGVPGIRSLVMFRPETGQYLYQLAQVLLRGDSPISSADRELIAAYVSHKNDCAFCRNSHAAAARCLYDENRELVDDVLENFQQARANPKLKALLIIAGKVKLSGKQVETGDIEAARLLGANDREIHDTVLIAACFCMFNRYVDGLASSTPIDPSIYEEMGKHMKRGYFFSQPFRPNT